MSHAKELLTAKELAERLRVRPETVRVWSRRGLIPRVQLSPKVIRYDLTAVVDALTRQQGKGGD
ncbi:MAG: helix-turn-helix domain-containing protein [Planctomycetota bacterium]